ncbi:hypothetical protein BDR06DRAFT_1007953 [Suillus hirtellus]|nr:hypothetical protein BDR06DRAFT_1007953 [Suillus hirtellus]
MPSQPAGTTMTHCTCPSNAIAHPEKAEQAAAWATAVEAGAKRIAGIELEMEAKQTSMLARKAKGVQPHPIPTKGKKAAVKDGLSQADVTAAYGEGDEMGLKDDSKKKITKVSMKDAVNQAHEQIKQTTSADGGDKDACIHKKGDSMDVTVNKPKYTLSSKVKSWVSDVGIPIKNQNAPPSHVTHTSPPPSTVFSCLMGSSKTTHSEIPTGIFNSPQCSGVDEDIPGGFADDEDEDEIDKLEHLAAHGITTKEGRSAAAMVLTLTIDDSDDELEISAEFCALFTQPSPVGFLCNFLSVDAFDNTMEIDLPDKSDLMYEVKPGKPPRTTSSTSVMTTDVKPALTKKAKVESLKVSTSLHATPAKPKEHSQESLWSIPDETLLTHIQIAFQAVYPELNLVIVQNGAVFSLTVQWLSEWRSNFGSTAIAIIFDFLISNNDCDPEVLAGLLLKNFTFIFKDMDKCKPDGAFHSAFMLQLLGKVHISTINGHATIPALKTKDLATKGMAGVHQEKTNFVGALVRAM